MSGLVKELFADGGGEAVTILRGAKQAGQERDQIGIGGEVADQLIVRAEEFAVFPGVFDGHAATDGGEFEGAHGVAVAIGAADEAEIDGGVGDEGGKVFGAGVAMSEGSESGLAAPVAAPEVQWEAGLMDDGHEADTVGISTTDEDDVSGLGGVGGDGVMHIGREGEGEVVDLWPLEGLEIGDVGAAG